MAKLTTRQAIRLLLTSDDYLEHFLKSGYSMEYRRQLRHRFKQQALSMQIQEELLIKCGFTVAQEKQWYVRY
ncbi:hypothetical protein [Spirosoma koreense]